jgi:hypothetical protein
MYTAPVNRLQRIMERQAQCKCRVRIREPATVLIKKNMTRHDSRVGRTGETWHVFCL